MASGLFPADAGGGTGLFPTTDTAEAPVASGLFPSTSSLGTTPAPGSLSNNPFTNPFAAAEQQALIEAGQYESPAHYGTSGIGAQMTTAQIDAIVTSTGLPYEEAAQLFAQGESGETSSDVTEDIQAAIARVAVYNEDLAKDLAARYESEENAEDKSFFDHIKDGVGDLLQPALAIGAKALDILIRPSQIIPELIVDKEDDPWYEDIGQALSGNSKAHGADVLEKWGVENGLAKGIGGFVLDVALDPLTWVTFGAGGVGRQVASETTQQVLGKGYMTKELLAAKNAGVKELASFSDDSIGLLAEQAWNKAVQTLPTIGDEGAYALVGSSIAQVPDELLRAAFKFADPAVEAVKQTGKIKQAMLAAGRTPEEVEAAMGMLRNARTANNFTDSWKTARGAAAATGGIRVRAGIPFTNFRFVSGAIPGTERFGFDILRNYFRGMSGMNRVQKAVASGLGTTQDVTTFLDKGLGGLKSTNTALFEHLTHGRLGGQSMFYEMSRRVGRATAAMSPSSLAYRRGGIASNMALSAKRDAKGLKNTFAQQYVYTLQRGADEEGMDFKQVAATIKKLKGGDANARRYNAYVWGDEAAEVADDEKEILDLVRKLIHQGAQQQERHGVVSGFRVGSMEGIDAATPKQADEIWGAGSHVVTRGVDVELVDAQNVQFAADPINATHGELAYGYRIRPNAGQPDVDDIDVFNAAKDEFDEFLRAETMSFDEVKALFKDRPEAGMAGLKFAGWKMHADKLQHYSRGGAPLGTQNAQDAFDNVADYTASRVEKYTRLEKEAREELVKALPKDSNLRKVLEKGDAVDPGIFSKRATPRFRARTHHPLIIREGTDANGLPFASDLPKIERLNAEVDAAIEQAKELHMNGAAMADKLRVGGVEQKIEDLASGAGLSETEWLTWKMQKRTELVTKYLQDVEGYDSIVRLDESGKLIDGTIFTGGRMLDEAGEEVGRGSNILRVDDNAEPFLRPNQMPLYFTDAARSALFGETKAAKKAVHQLPPKVRNAFDGLSYEEATAKAREMLPEGSKFTGDMFIVDPRKVLAEFADEAGSNVAKQYLGEVGAHMGSTMGRWGVGGVVNAQVFRIPDTLNQANIAAMSAEARAAYRTWQQTRDDHTKAIEEMASQAGMGRAVLRQRMAAVDEARKAVDESTESIGRAILNQQDEVVGEIARVKRALAERTRLQNIIKAGDDRAVRRVAGRSKEEVIQNVEKAKFGQAKITVADARAQLDQLEDEADLQQRLAELGDTLTELRKWQKGKKVAPGTAAAVDGAVKARGAAKAKLTRAEKKLFDKPNLEVAKAIKRLDLKIDEALNQANVMRTRLHTESAKALPAIVEETVDMTGFVPLAAIHPNMKGLKAHPYIAEEFKSALGGRNIGDARKWYREVLLGPWKKWATIYYPGFHARNNMGAMFNNLLGGVTPADYWDSYRISRALSGSKKYREMPVPEDKMKAWGLKPFLGDNGTYEEAGLLMQAMGIRGTNSQAFADVRPLIDDLRKLSGADDKKRNEVLKKIGQATGGRYARFARAGTDITENFHRQAAFLAGLSATDGSLAGARMFTMMRHGDYEDLNDFEEGVKDLIPFYKWMRTNLPYQIHNLLESPGKHLAMVKGKRAGYEMQGLDHDDEMRKQPGYMQEMFTIPLPGNATGEEALNLLVMDLPMADLHQGANDFLASMVPIVRPLIESYVIEKNIFTGSDIKGKRVPLAAWADNAVMKPLLSQLGWIEYDTDGKPTIDDRTQNLMSMVPVFSRARNWVFSDPASQEKRASALMSTFLGLRVQHTDDSTLSAAEYQYLKNEVEPLIANLRELGVYLPERDMISPEVWETLGFEYPTKEEESPASTIFANPFAPAGGGQG